MKKRMISAVLALCMVLALLLAETMAAEWRDADAGTTPLTELDTDGMDTPQSEDGSEPNNELQQEENDGDATGDASDSSEPDTASVLASGTCGANLTWVLTEDGTLTISGKGHMYDYYDSVPWQENAKQIQTLIIEGGVTSIGNYAFF